MADYGEQDDPGSRLLAALRYRGGVGAPITIGARLWGAVIAADREPARFRASDEERLVRFAEPLALAVAHAEGGDRIVSDTAAAIFASQLEMEPTLRAVAASARQALRAHRASCYLLSPDGAACEAVYTTEPDPKLRARLEAFAGRPAGAFPLWALLLGSRTACWWWMTWASSPMGADRRGDDVGSLIGVRLEHNSVRDSPGGPMLGALFVSFCEPRSFSTRERAAARSLGSMASVAMANARLHAQTVRSLEEARERATLDPLTGLLNHRAFQERLAREVARARGTSGRCRWRCSTSTTSSGSTTRTATRRATACWWRRAGASGGRPARGRWWPAIGGEEFAWLLPETDEDGGLPAAERARARSPRGRSRAPARSPPRPASATSTRRATPERAAAAGRRRAVPGEGPRARRVSAPRPRPVDGAPAQERAEQSSRDALAALRALARAIDAKDPPRRATPSGCRAGRAAGASRRLARTRAATARRGLAARRRQDRRPRRDPAQAGRLTRRGVRPGQAATPRSARADRRRGAVARAGALDPPPPRALGRARLPRRARAVTRSRRAPGCWRWPTRGTR